MEGVGSIVGADINVAVRKMAGVLVGTPERVAVPVGVRVRVGVGLSVGSITARLNAMAMT